MTKAPTEEDLMAFVDGELDAAGTATLLQHLNQSPDLRSRLAVYTESRDLLDRLYVGHALEPVPERLLNVINDASATPRPNWLSSMRLRIADMITSTLNGSQEFRLPQMATVGALMLVAGIFVGQIAPGNLIGDRSSALETQFVQIGPIASDSPLTLGLTKTAAGQTLDFSEGNEKNGQRFKAILTFISKAQRPCRQFSIASASGSLVNAVACLGRENTWHIVSASHTEIKEEPGAGAEYRRAETGANPEMKATLDRLMHDIPLEEHEEQRLMQSQWKMVEPATK